MSSVLQQRLERELSRRRQQQLYRRRRCVEPLEGAWVRVDGRRCLNFCSNDYLGLATHPGVREAMRRALDALPAGSGAAHLITGHGRDHEALEQELAEFVGRPRALLFSTGYMANMGTINALIQPDDLVLEDRLNHASLLDGGWLSRGQMQRYAHADMADLERRLSESRAPHRLVVTDGVFSMDGDTAPLAQLAALCRQQDATLMVDDAHGLGVLGPSGSGSVRAAGLDTQAVPVYMGTLGKAVGTFGAFVAGDEDLIEFLIQRARTYVYTTAPPPAVTAATRAALRITREDNWRREHLGGLIARFREGLQRAGIRPPASDTPIQPLLVGDPGHALWLAQALEADGLLVTAIRPPTVPENTARLRITLSAAHSEADVDALVAALVRHLTGGEADSRALA
jgi:8-amino-7-oxononanoate synthase